jgi:hypothetical protein
MRDVHGEGGVSAFVSFSNRERWEKQQPSLAEPANIAEKGPRPTEHQQQYRELEKAVNAIIDSGHLGDPKRIDYSVSMSLHATVAHVPGSVGTPNDNITLNIQVLGLR